MTERGKFIVVEGSEGAGKSTVVNVIANYLQTNLHKPLIQTREPGGTVVGEKLRNILKEQQEQAIDARCELLLMYAARVQLVNTIIMPALQRGEWVLADRFEPSTYAYQGGGRGIDKSVIDTLSQICLNGFQPDLIFFLDVSPQSGLARAASRGEMDRIEKESLDFFDKVRQAYLSYFANRDNVVCIDSEQPAALVSQQITQELQQRYA